MIIRNIIYRICALVLCASCFSVTVNAEVKSNLSITKVYISQTAQHAALDITTEAVVEGLAKRGYYRGSNLDLMIDYAQSSQTLAAQIATKFVSHSPDIVVSVGTLSAQSFLKFIKNDQVKMVFVSVTDPVSAGLVKANNKGDSSIAGVTNFIPIEPQLELFKKLLPSIKKLGFLYNPGEVNSLIILKLLQDASHSYGIEIVPQTATKTVEIMQSASQLATVVDAIFISNDNTALSAIKSIVAAAKKASIPVFVSDVDAIEDGCYASLGPDQYQLGIQAADMIADIIEGKRDIGQIGTEYPKVIKEKINPNGY